jgi:TrmH family RNA methyltransferase
MLSKAAIQRMRSLRERKERDRLGLFVVEGEKIIRELQSAGYPFEDVYATESWNAPYTVRVTTAEMARISHFSEPSAALAIARLQRESLPADALKSGWTLALDGVQDPGNVGTILRIADWYAFDRVLLSPECADPYAPKAIQASMGSFARTHFHSLPLAGALSSAKISVLGCDLEGEDVHALGPLKGAVVVIGSEGRGLSPDIRLLCRRITIPRRGQAQSLNAAIATAIVCDVLRNPRD